jgi:hypothetical protein
MLANLAPSNLHAQDAVLNSELALFQHGCVKLLESIKAQDKYTLYDAQELLSKVRLTPLEETTLLAGKENIVLPTIWYLPSFADSLALHNFSLVNLDPIHQLRDSHAKVAVMHVGLREKSTVTYRTYGSGKCQILVIGSGDGPIHLESNDFGVGKKYQGQSVNHNPASSFVAWEMDDERDYDFTISNLSASETSLVIATIIE